ncbi:MAG: preprotein translocase subunit SecG [Candidatus Nanopelagicales bacterium]|nr:preprotein translocase subunit SecG [Candidatus Nanopelagicales bacterium]MCF8538754.1 preprotein translocase subunit SecG [Candidatus Nanopelagicales bacterium]MCF8550883.1 preprotein translocase subunit SecG [Candidatus Nanopelagicales bacterium]
MNAITIALAVILIITSVLLVVLILLHRGKGGGLSDLFGGGVSSSVGGSSVAEKNLDRLTVALGLIWAAAIIAVGLLVRTGS